MAVALEEDLAGARQLGVEEAFSSTTTRAAAARRPHVEFDAVLPLSAVDAVGAIPPSHGCRRPVGQEWKREGRLVV